jgi:hypothetical protein
MTWDELVAEATARHPPREAKMVTMPWSTVADRRLRRRLLVPESQSDEWQRLVEQAVA